MGKDEGNGFSEWGGYMDAKISKLEEQFAASSDPFRETNLFAGISIFVNGRTDPSADELKRIMMVHGGTFHIYERSHTTFIIAANLPDVKVRNMNTSKIISAQWVVDCIKENRILDYSKYLLYTNQKVSQPRIMFQKREEPKVDVQVNDDDVADILKDLDTLNTLMKESGSTGLDKDNTSIIDKSSVENEEKQQPESNQSLNSSKGAARTAVDPKFLSEFYNNSRLHHIATLGAGFKQYITDLRESHTGSFAARSGLLNKLPKTENFKPNEQTVMHIDMDCFFVSVGLRSRPHLRGQPIAVTHSKGGKDVPVREGVDRQAEKGLFMKRYENNKEIGEKIRNGFDGKTDSLSEIASCSYEARRLGVKNGMFVGQALKLCPQLKTIPYDFEGYKEVAHTLYDSVAQYTLNIEAVSCDEMFVDLTDLLNEIRTTPMAFVEALRDEVREKTGCPCSAGVGGNRLQARMATKKAKPDGQYYLDPESVQEYMCDIPISDLPGVGNSTSYTLKKLNWKTCGDLQRISLLKLQAEFGKKFGENLYQNCRGIDSRPLVFGQIRKSVSAEVNYGIRFKENSEMETFVRQLCTEVHTRLTDIKRKGKCITLKVMVRAKEAPVETSKFMGHGVCDHQTKSVSLSDFTADVDVISRTVLATMRSLNIPPHELRGIGIQISKLDDPSERKENVIKNMFSKAVEKKKVEVPQKKPDLPESTPARTSISPIKKESPTKKRPKATKKSTATISKKKPTNKVNVGEMLQKAPSRKRPNLSELPSDIDPEVWAALPDDIKEEILRDRAKVAKPTAPAVKPSTSSSTNTKQEMDQEFLDALPPDIREEVIADLNKTKLPESKPQATNKQAPQISADNIFHQNECNRLILAWIQSTECPQNYDVDLISKDAVEFVKLKRILNLYDSLCYLCRIINKTKNCSWHSAYKMVIENVQTAMKIEYGAKMFLKERLVCDKCCNS